MKTKIHKGTVPADNFLSTVAENVDNEKLTDSDFREFIRSSLAATKLNQPVKKFEAKVQFGLFGYVLSEETFNSKTLEEMVKKINNRIRVLTLDITRADEEDGDLRRYTPQFANGYLSSGGIEPEFGEEFCGALLILTADGKELEYKTDEYAQLLNATGLN